MKKCLIIFKGWASEEELYSDIERLFSRYKIFYDIEVESFDFEGYDEIICLAWSMGTLDAIELSNKIKLDKLILLAPTLSFTRTMRPIILKKMKKRLEIDKEGCLKDFTLNSFYSKEKALKFWKINREKVLNIPTVDLKKGLDKLINKEVEIERREIKTVIVVGEKDKIIPFENSKEVIEGYTHKIVYKLPCGHNIFSEQGEELIDIIKDNVIN